MEVNQLNFSFIINTYIKLFLRRQNAEEKEAERQAANKLLMSLKQQQQQNTVPNKKMDLTELDKTQLKSDLFNSNANSSKLTAAAVAAAAAFAASTISAISPGSNSSHQTSLFSNPASLNQLILMSNSNTDSASIINKKDDLTNK